VQFDRRREKRLLVIPALFDEANKLRRLTVEVMRRLDLSGIDSFLPDLAGMNDSLMPLEDQTMTRWKEQAEAAARHFRATCVLSLRGGSLIAPDTLPGWQYAPQTGTKQLRSMLRARTIAGREAGRDETIAALQTQGRSEGIELAGWRIGAEMFSGLESAEPSQILAPVSQDVVGGTGLWLRAEPDEDPEQADALAGIIAIALDDAG